MKKINKEQVILGLLNVGLIVLLIGLIGFGIWVLVTYGNKPITEVPSWVLMIMNR